MGGPGFFFDGSPAGKESTVAGDVVAEETGLEITAKEDIPWGLEAVGGEV